MAESNSAAVLPYLLLLPFSFSIRSINNIFWPRVTALIISSFSADEMSGAVIFLAPSLVLCHSHFPSVMSLRRSCLVTLWCHISSADGSLSPLQHVHRCYNWSPEWISKVAPLIMMWASNSACCLMASADQIPVGDVGETPGILINGRFVSAQQPCANAISLRFVSFLFHRTFLVKQVCQVGVTLLTCLHPAAKFLF